MVITLTSSLPQLLREAEGGILVVAFQVPASLSVAFNALALPVLQTQQASIPEGPSVFAATLGTGE
ncbi:hypothetical protein HAALTHF_28180n [Vreelandella aquamarina]|nr:hypothetical protein HAALTHF_28180n [Halomonas axialensis]